MEEDTADTTGCFGGFLQFFVWGFLEIFFFGLGFFQSQGTALDEKN